MSRLSSGNSATYSAVAHLLGLRHCGDGSDQRHWTGYIEWDETPCLHWTDRRMTKRGLRTFLKLAARALVPDANPGRAERFVALYWQNVEADRLAQDIGVRFPRDLADPDRAKVRFWLAKFRNDLLDREFREQRTLMRRIQRWSRA